MSSTERGELPQGRATAEADPATAATSPTTSPAGAKVCKALGDPARLRILKLLPRTPKVCDALYNVNELSAELGLPQPTVSHHLKILREAGVIRYTKRCNSVYYYLDARNVRLAWKALYRETFKR